ncbi:MAG: HU family DNA-binding protein [Solobacterium sp.]|nr:HU family DNA-binding protein [Solobacterium sp.]
MDSINKKFISEVIAEKHDLTKKESAEILDLVFDTITDALIKGERVDITGFGRFEVKTRASRTGINPQTKETIEINATKVPGFKASKSLKDKVR